MRSSTSLVALLLLPHCASAVVLTRPPLRTAPLPPFPTAPLARSPLRTAPMSMSAKNALATLASTRVLVSGTAFGVLVWRRDAASVLCITGAVINAIFSKILKRLINESRPAGAQESDPGMPSSHAMSLFFFATYLVLLAATAPTLPLLPPGPTPRVGAAVVVLGLATYGAVHRVRSGLHTPAQICVGAAIGAADAALWLLWAQPRLQRALSGGQLVALASVFVVIGALTIGSVERWLRRRGGLRAVLKGD